MKSFINKIVLSDPIWKQSTLPWVGHIPFAFWLIDVCRPKQFVELGTHMGNSYFAFCQAVQMTGAKTKCLAVDTWTGDEHAGYYGEDVFEMVNSHNEEKYSNFSTLMKMTFDEALEKFVDHSIDILHIDGLHTYDAVKHDFDSWLPKLSDKGVILLHDICVKEKGFGVWRLWGELQERYQTFQFKHSYGLGVIAVGKHPPDQIIELLACQNAEKEEVEKIFEKFGNEVYYHTLSDYQKDKLVEYETQIHNQDQHCNNLEQQIKDQDLHRQNLERQIKDQDLYRQNLERHIKDQDLYRQNLEQQIKDQDLHRQNLEQQIKDQDLHRQNLEQQIKKQDLYRQNIEQHIKDQDLHRQNLEQHIKDQELHRQDLEQQVKKQDAHRQSLEKRILEASKILENKEQELQSLYYSLTRTVEERERILKERNEIEAEMSVLFTSWSWKLTRPLRFIYEILTDSSGTNFKIS